MLTLRGVLDPLLVLLGLVALVYWYLQRQFSFWARKGAPFKKPHLFYGNIGDIFTAKRSVAEGFADIYNEFKDERFVGIWEFSTPKMIVRDPELLKSICIRDFDCWVDRGTNFNEEVDPLSAHLANLTGKRWKAVRSKLTPTFTSGKLKKMFHLLLECGRDFEIHLKAAADSKKPVEVRDMSARFTTDVIGSCAFGIQMNSLSDEDAKFRAIGKKLFEEPFYMKINKMIQVASPMLFKVLKLKLTLPETEDFFLNVTKETFEFREKNKVERHDFMDLLRELKNTDQKLEKDEVLFDDKLLTAQALVFFGAGFETSSTAISYCMHELAANEQIQERLRKEVQETKAKNNGEITFESLKIMPYLDQVFNEILRKCPPVPVVMRECVKPYTIPGTNIDVPVGLMSVIPIYAIHHDPEYYPDPEKFDPERFTEEAKASRHPFTYIPFGGGPRVCIGLRFAELQTKLGLAILVDKFKISLCEKSTNPLSIEEKAHFLTPKGGIWLRITSL